LKNQGAYKIYSQVEGGIFGGGGGAKGEKIPLHTGRLKALQLITFLMLQAYDQAHCYL